MTCKTTKTQTVHDKMERKATVCKSPDDELNYTKRHTQDSYKLSKGGAASDHPCWEVKTVYER